MNKLILFCKMIKIEHSIFALPFAYIGLFLAQNGWPGINKFIFVTLAMVGVRSYAMAMNRIIDLKFDKENPRTKNRPLVTGELSLFEAYVVAFCFGLLFVISCLFLNKLCFYLSFFALIWATLYSYTKRFTTLCHFWLGSVLAMAPIGGWLGVIPQFHPVPVAFALGVLFWVAGFDILYAIQDVEFDGNINLYSLPSRLGIGPSLWISTMCHVVTILFFFLGGWFANLGLIYFIGLGIVASILIVEHLVVTENRLSKINLAFFTLNAFVAMAVFISVFIDIFIK